ncbi:hypothetical protein D5S17_12475 [Pseudonocardiaceae bacterium YIM PH 21723]|nr:hypothetical protein D5S17_12475 [Pseudonocardiaceae bacterium YIM PH 21723]
MSRRILILCCTAVLASCAFLGAQLAVDHHETDPAAVRQRLHATLGDRLASSYYDPGTRRLVANVTDEHAARVAWRTGADPRLVQRGR